MPATKEEIANTFQRHVERYGYGRASVEGVAAELGISKRTIYQMFSSKKDLYGFIVGRVAQAERVRLESEISGESTWRAKTEKFLRIVVSGMRAHIQETSKADWLQEFEVAYDAMAGAYGAIGVRLLSEGYGAGEFEFQDAELANALIGAMVTQYGVMVREDRGYDADEELVSAIMRMLGCAEGAVGGKRV